ncbi:hypothetical protein [Caulobacter soli]|uniref:hypothetical protein n=1 Tax=Caulobacter soli TaxID=2708539 RepID=UPI0013EDEAE4|nr:hypothetical protein [Caulobacter soli]
MKFDIAKLAGEICAGANNGRVLLRTMIDAVGSSPQEPTIIFLDFAGVEAATASFLREGVVAFRTSLRSSFPNYYPVLANGQNLVVEELLTLLDFMGEVFISCQFAADGAVSDVRLLGTLDPKQKFAFDLVMSKGETDAGELFREFGESEGVKQTAWNNRLSALSSAGVVFEISSGRGKRYRTLFKGV